MVDPTLITALATLVAAVTALLKVWQTGSKVDATTATVADAKTTIEQVHANTNGTLDQLRAEIASLRATQATPVELAARNTQATASELAARAATPAELAARTPAP